MADSTGPYPRPAFMQTIDDPFWLDAERVECFEGFGFLLETLNTTTGERRLRVATRPGRTGSAGRLYGCCGTSSNISLYACGIAFVLEARNERVKVARVVPTEEILERLGWPELFNEEESR